MGCMVRKFWLKQEKAVFSCSRGMCQSITRQGRSLGLSRYMPENVFLMVQKMKTERLVSVRMGLSWRRRFTSWKVASPPTSALASRGSPCLSGRCNSDWGKFLWSLNQWGWAIENKIIFQNFHLMTKSTTSGQPSPTLAQNSPLARVSTIASRVDSATWQKIDFKLVALPSSFSPAGRLRPWSRWHTGRKS